MTDTPEITEAEALLSALGDNGNYGDAGQFYGMDKVEEVVTALLDAVKAQTEPPAVTDEMVEASARGGHAYLQSRRPEDHGPYRAWEQEEEHYREYLRGIQRAALEAALTVSLKTEPPAEDVREALATIIQGTFPHEGGGYSLVWEDCFPAADAILARFDVSPKKGQD